MRFAELGVVLFAVELIELELLLEIRKKCEQSTLFMAQLVDSEFTDLLFELLPCLVRRGIDTTYLIKVFVQL